MATSTWRTHSDGCHFPCPLPRSRVESSWSRSVGSKSRKQRTDARERRQKKTFRQSEAERLLSISSWKQSANKKRVIFFLRRCILTEAGSIQAQQATLKNPNRKKRVVPRILPHNNSAFFLTSRNKKWGGTEEKKTIDYHKVFPLFFLFYKCKKDQTHEESELTARLGISSSSSHWRRSRRRWWSIRRLVHFFFSFICFLLFALFSLLVGSVVSVGRPFDQFAVAVTLEVFLPLALADRHLIAERAVKGGLLFARRRFSDWQRLRDVGAYSLAVRRQRIQRSEGNVPDVSVPLGHVGGVQTVHGGHL